MIEKWKPIKGYEGIYEISNMGRVKSNHEIINPYMLSMYFGVCIGGESKYVHHLVWDHFSEIKEDRSGMHIDHIDENKINNRIDNLQLLTPRENSVKYAETLECSSKYVGVTRNKTANGWVASISIRKKNYYLGVFNTEEDARKEYIRALNELNKTGKITTIKPKRKGSSSKYRGVCWHKRDKKWSSKISKNHKIIHLGNFDTEYDAHLAYEKKKKEFFPDYFCSL